jgi:enoyl-CoA hydratase/carnithine racemase
MMTAVVETHIDASIATVMVCRPEVHNALNRDVLVGLLDAFRNLSRNRGVRAIILTGQGDRAFVAGADIAMFQGLSPAEAMAFVNDIRDVTAAIAACRQPVIASIQGHCLGGGLELALACDLRIASATAMLGLPEIKLGIIPGGGGTVRLTQAVGTSLAHYMTMTGKPIAAQRAFDIGLIHEIHAPADLPDATTALSRRMADHPPFALAQLKSSLAIAAGGGSTETALTAEIQAFALCFSTEDQIEGVDAFLTKREPRFTGL